MVVNSPQSQIVPRRILAIRESRGYSLLGSMDVDPKKKKEKKNPNFSPLVPISVTAIGRSLEGWGSIARHDSAWTFAVAETELSESTPIA